MRCKDIGVLWAGVLLSCSVRGGGEPPPAPPPPPEGAQPSLVLESAAPPNDDKASEKATNDMDTKSEGRSSLDSRYEPSVAAATSKKPKKPLKYEVADFAPEASDALSLLVDVIADAPPSQNPNSNRCLAELHLELLRASMASSGVLIKDVNAEGDMVCIPDDVSISPDEPWTECTHRIVHMMASFNNAMRPSGRSSEILARVAKGGVIVSIEPSFYELVFENRGDAPELIEVRYHVDETH